MNYKIVNNVTGWIAFSIALVVYLMTMAPTASFWDCGEFIACANELEVPHPPGAPFFLVLGRFFAIFASEPTQVAYMVNLVSVISSAFCVMFIFWTVTYLAKKISAPKDDKPDGATLFAIMASGMVAALATTFADSFWFNAVEAEVYALSSFFTATVVWLMFKWEARADEEDNFKWLILIAFVMGASIGVHLLNLLTIPALAFIYYFRKHEVNMMGAAITFVISVVILGVIQYGLIQFSVEIAWAFERMFTGTEEMNSSAGAYNATGMGMPMGTGLVLFLVLSLGILLALLAITQFDKLAARFFAPGSQVRVVLNTSVWSVLVIIIGYSSYTMIVVRAKAGTPINENDPSNTAAMLSYLKREQYGDRPLFSGVRYNDQSSENQVLIQDRKSFVTVRAPRKLVDGAYVLENGQSLAVKNGKAGEFAIPALPAGDSVYTTELKDGRKIAIDSKTKKVTRIESRYLWQGYKQDVEYRRGNVLFPRMHSGQGGHYSGAFGYKEYTTKQGPTDSPFDDNPTMANDLSFFFDYQVRHMYFRYFMWNFVGREGDIQDMQWESGFNRSRLAALPEEMRNNPGKNHYFFLPLLFGLLGVVYQFSRNWKDGTSVMLLFFFTGLAIILYLNQTPMQPRERDYSYAGSFQTFAMWIGLAVIALYEGLRELMKNKSLAAALAWIPISGPILMGQQGWDDHNRHLRWVDPDSAYNLLMSCEKNAIIFTNGDNDTFPLWYIQEVENVRSDVRVVNLSLLNTDWYIDQMRQQSNESPALPITADPSEYVGEVNSYRQFDASRPVNIPVDRSKVLANGTVQKDLAGYIESPLPWKVTARGGSQRGYLLKQDWLIMDMILTNARNGWERPIYFSSTIPPSSFLGLQPYFQVEGLANRVVPVNFAKMPCPSNDPYGRQGRVDKDKSYQKVMNEFRYRDLDNEDLYLDDHVRRTIVGNLASMIFRTANAFVDAAECAEAQNAQLRLMLKSDSTGAKADSIQGLISANKKSIESDRKKGAEVLEMAEKRISDKARGYDIIFPTFAGMVWERLDNVEKATSYFDKVITKAENWYKFNKEYEEKLDDYDRIFGTLPFLLQQLDRMKEYNLAMRAAQVLYSETASPEYGAMVERFRQKAGTENPVPLPDSGR